MTLKLELTSSILALQIILILWGAGSLSASDVLLKGLFAKRSTGHFTGKKLFLPSRVTALILPSSALAS